MHCCRKLTVFFLGPKLRQLTESTRLVSEAHASRAMTFFVSRNRAEDGYRIGVNYFVICCRAHFSQS
jgi:hypothetical protein